MRQFKKPCSRAVKYKLWLKQQTGGKHPKYVSSSRFYIDIKANLMCCQGGVCAYTELKLDDSDYFENTLLWKEGKFKGNKEIQGQLDHFDASLKKQNGWSWANFFLCHSDINNAKNNDIVYAFMKPDTTNYSPYKYLDYNYILHIYTISPKIKKNAEKLQIKKMIETLGLNYGSIQRLRAKYLNDIFIDFHKKTKKLDDLKVNQFFTAFEIIKLKLKKTIPNSKAIKAKSK